MLAADLLGPAARAAVAVRPAGLEQVGAARRLVGEAALELHDRAGEGRTRHRPTVGQASDGPNRIVMSEATFPSFFRDLDMEAERSEAVEDPGGNA